MTIRAKAIAFSAAALLVVASCSSSDDGEATGGPDTTVAGDASTTAPAGDAEVLRILVSNDDGYAAEGIDVLVEALGELPDVEVTVVAPAEERSGTSGKTTLGELDVSDAETASGHPTSAVDGFPADSVIVALEELEIEPHLVITGINAGQNVGAIVDVSGTVGAARAAVARGIPALATSQGVGPSFDFEAGVVHVIEWVEEHREALLAGDAPVEVASMNFPSCETGEMRGLLEVESDVTVSDDVLTTQDCASEVDEAELGDEVAAFNNGYATLSILSDDPVEPYEVVDPSADVEAPAA